MRLHHRVVDVAHHGEAGVLAWHQDAPERARPRVAGELELDRLPAGGKRPRRRQLEAEVAFAVGAQLAHDAAKARTQPRPGHFVRLYLFQEGDEVAPAPLAFAGRPDRLVAQHAPRQHQLLGIAVAPVRQDYRIGVFWSCTISHSPPRFSNTSVR